MNCKALLNIAIEIALYKYCIIIIIIIWNGAQITCGSKYRNAIRRVSIIQPSLFYF